MTNHPSEPSCTDQDGEQAPATTQEPTEPKRVFRSPRERREHNREHNRGERPSKRKPIDGWLEGLLIATVAGSVISIGTAHVHTLLAVGVVSIASAVLALLVHRKDTGTWPFTLCSPLVW
jgi:hypothetical protein